MFIASSIALIVLFALTVYKIIDEKGYAYPSLLFSLGLIAVLISIWLESVALSIEKSHYADALQPLQLASLHRLLSSTFVVMAGGLIGFAISGRAKYLHSRRLAVLKGQYRRYSERIDSRSEMVRQLLSGPSGSDEAATRSLIERYENILDMESYKLETVADKISKICRCNACEFCFRRLGLV